MASMDLEKFRKADFKRRTARVQVPALSDFFDEDVPVEIEVQGITGPEVFQAENRMSSNEAVEIIAQKLASPRVKVVAEGVMEAFGLTESVPKALVKAIAYVEFGTVLDGFEQGDAVRLAEYHPDTFLTLFGKINELTGLGHVSAGESNATGTTPESARQ